MADRLLDDAVVIDALLATRDLPEGWYGRRKMTAHLRRVGGQRHEAVLAGVPHHTVDRLMRDLGLQGVRRGRRVRTTIADPAARLAPLRAPGLGAWLAVARSSGPVERSRCEQVALGVADQVLHHALALRISGLANVRPEGVVRREAHIVRVGTTTSAITPPFK